MMKKKNITSENYLDRKPCRISGINWYADDKGLVTLEVENRGIFNRIAQKFFKKPEISYVHLDETGSFVWQLIDGSKSIIDLGEDVERKFGEAAMPLYERLMKYFCILDSYGFITWQ